MSTTWAGMTQAAVRRWVTVLVVWRFGYEWERGLVTRRSETDGDYNGYRLWYHLCVCMLVCNVTHHMRRGRDSGWRLEGVLSQTAHTMFSMDVMITHLTRRPFVWRGEKMNFLACFEISTADMLFLFPHTQNPSASDQHLWPTCLECCFKTWKKRVFLVLTSFLKHKEFKFCVLSAVKYLQGVA